MDQSDFVKGQEARKKEKLYARGWRQVGWTRRGSLLWSRPESDGGGHLTEEEALAFVERLEREELK